MTCRLPTSISPVAVETAPISWRTYVPYFSENNTKLPAETPPSIAPDDLSIMILPLACQKSDVQQTSLSAYITEELSLKLGLFPELSVFPVQTRNDTYDTRQCPKATRFLISGN